MTSAEKQKIADFLDRTGNYLYSGYKTEHSNYCFEDSSPPVSDIRPLSISEELEKTAKEIRSCKNCSLCENRTNAVPGEGVLHPLVMVIGEGPGADEDAQGRPFVGRAGQLLDKMLSSINLSRTTNCFIANVVKCRPPNNREPGPDETAACAIFLDRQINLLKPKFILAAGRVAAQTLLKTNEPILKLHGKWKQLTIENNVYPLLVTYHPAAILRDEEKKRPAWEDLKLLRSKLENNNGEN